jgi:hypothetical protein
MTIQGIGQKQEQTDGRISILKSITVLIGTVRVLMITHYIKKKLKYET